MAHFEVRLGDRVLRQMDHVGGMQYAVLLWKNNDWIGWEYCKTAEGAMRYLESRIKQGDKNQYLILPIISVLDETDIVDNTYEKVKEPYNATTDDIIAYIVQDTLNTYYVVPRVFLNNEEAEEYCKMRNAFADKSGQVQEWKKVVVYLSMDAVKKIISESP